MPNSEEKVGYKSPPKETQFTKGTSGNPKGRPKGSKNLKSILKAELEGKISIQEKGRVVKVTKQEAIIKTIVNNTLKGDKHASQILIRMMTGIMSDIEEPTNFELPAEDLAILGRYMGGNKDE